MNAQLTPISEIVQTLDKTSNYAIITDDKVEKLYLKHFQKLLREHNIKHHLFTFKNGEANKTLHTAEQIINQMIEKHCDRKTTIIAYGGGVVTDLAGLIASIFMRGIQHINIPTTLLGMVDAAIGGKTATNTKNGKNLIGTYHHAKQTYIDPQHLQSLSKSHIKNGIAEIIKIATIADKNLFEYLEKNHQAILSLQTTQTTHIITQAIKLKEQIVKKDPTDQNKRLLLNYGHTFGHVIEKNTNYKLLHGFAISIGMVLANKIAIQEKLLTEEQNNRIKNLLKLYGLPTTTLHKPKLSDLKTDKKREGNFLNFVLPTAIGKAVIKKIPCT